MPTYRVYLARPTTPPLTWDFAITVVTGNQQQALNNAYQDWLKSAPNPLPPPLNQCRSQVKPLNLTNNNTEVKMAHTDAVQYTLTVINNSTNAANIAVFQQDPSISTSKDKVFPLAWFVKYSYPKTKIKFSWAINYNFVWSQTGMLAPGVVFDATQNPGADLKENNQITLDYDPINNAYFFNPGTPITAPPLDVLRVIQSKEIPLKQASVGIGMSGFGTFAVQAQPNLTVTFTPHPKYYIIAGDFTQGEVIDILQVTKAPEVPFDPGVYQMTAILNQDNTWTIKPTSQVNELFLQLKETESKALWGAF